MAKKNIYKSTALNGIRKEANLDEGVYIKIIYGYIDIEHKLPVVCYAKMPTSEIAELVVGLLDKMAILVNDERDKSMFILNGNYDKFYKKFKKLFIEKNFIKPNNKLRMIINKLKNTSVLNEGILTEVIRGLNYLFMDIEYYTALPQYVKIIRVNKTSDENNIMPDDIFVRASELRQLIDPLLTMIIDLYKSTNEGTMHALPYDD